ncbi:MAG: hypothetical protein LBK06_02130 [Planctomycetaceae bacterium]|nr:hypothetical protein [Planctomycetaceae bacterium]
MSIWIAKILNLRLNLTSMLQTELNLLKKIRSASPNDLNFRKFPQPKKDLRNYRHIPASCKTGGKPPPNTLRIMIDFLYYAKAVLKFAKLNTIA